MPAMIAYEDFKPGEVTTFGAYAVSREEILDYAREFDPQPFHLDEAAGAASMLGGLSASGWHSCAILMRLCCDQFVLGSTSMGGPGVEEVKWIRPVRPGDVLSVRCEILDARTSRSRPDIGIVRFRLELINQRGETCLLQTHAGLFGRRETASHV